MSFLRALFGPSKDEIWGQLAREVGAHFQEGGFWAQSRVQGAVGDWIVTLDTYTVSSGKSSVTYTRMRAPFVNRGGHHFEIYRSQWFSEVAKFFGMQDIAVGYPEFDRQFVIKGTSPEQVRGLFQNPRIRQLVHAQPAIYMAIRDDEGWFAGRFPQGVDELYFQVSGVIKDLEWLRALYALFAEMLEQLCHMDAAYEDDVEAHLRDLLGPGGRIETQGVLIWDGDPARRRAAEALGRMKDARAGPALVGVLADADIVLRVKAVWALGEIGDRRAVPFLIPLLGEPAEAERVTAADALSKLGEGALVDALRRTLQGERLGIEVLQGRYRPQVIRGLLRALRSEEAPALMGAAHALGELGAVEALAALRQALRTARREPLARDAVDAAIRRLEAQAALPRPAQGTPDPGAPDAGTLPRPAEATPPAPEGLPLPSAPAPEPGG